MDFPIPFVLSKEDLEQTKKIYDSLDRFNNKEISEEEFYSILSEELSIELINLFYRIYFSSYFNWGKKFALVPLPSDYKIYEERIRKDYELYQKYGQMLSFYYFNNRSSSFSNLPLHLQDDLEQYRISSDSIRLKTDRLPLDIPLIRWTKVIRDNQEGVVWV